MKRVLLTTFVILLAGLFSKPASAVPVLGEKLYYSGGNVNIEVLVASAGYHNFLGLYLLNPTQQQGTNLSENHIDVGAMISFDPSVYGYAVGDELIFGIAVYTGGSHTNPSNYLATFFMGDADRNPDNIFHAAVDDLGSGSYEVGFEDLLNGGDRDYNDTRFLFSSGVSTVPEPGTLLLLGAGLLGFGARRRMTAKA